jgi:hypothetical protein
LGISNCLDQHEYFRDTIIATYKECASCKTRTQFTCVKCGYCYSCHWKLEESGRIKSAFLEKYSPPATRVIEQPPPGRQMAMDVYGRQIEPICSYRTCHHKFSIHSCSGRNANAAILLIAHHGQNKEIDSIDSKNF